MRSVEAVHRPSKFRGPAGPATPPRGPRVGRCLRIGPARAVAADEAADSGPADEAADSAAVLKESPVRPRTWTLNWGLPRAAQAVVPKTKKVLRSPVL